MRPVRAALAAVTAALLVGAGGCATGAADQPAPAAAAVHTPADDAPASSAAADPVIIDIPAIGVHAGLMRLGLAADGTVEVPPLESPDGGWYEHSPAPGAVGPAILLGHVDSARTGPGVFYRLADLRPGDPVTVDRRDGSSVRFVVDRVQRYPKAQFPAAEVYGDIDHPGLRLITCGGAFDRAAHSYLDNVVVYASAVA